MWPGYLLFLTTILQASVAFNDIIEYPLPILNDTLDLEKLSLLSARLRDSLSSLRSQKNGLDIVFLVDASLSVGPENFVSELRFVRKILADFSIVHSRGNSTRVALVSYSSQDQVITHIDFISGSTKAPQQSRHKCSLMSQLAEVNYSGGLTFTVGAMKVADKLLKNSSRRVQQVVFLVTDGYSNGGDPKPIAHRLKADGVTVFTFGIKNGNIKELQEMATSSREHCFIVNSFEEFDALARRALHEDLSVGEYEILPMSQCASLCPEGRFCCNPGARCACGTNSGYFNCLCPPGHYGSGLRGDCKPCPEGTYQAAFVHGGIEECVPCPGPHQTSPAASRSREKCSCMKGYTSVVVAGNNITCMPVRCPPLEAPLNGFLVNDRCESVFNAACGVACDTGYNLTGSSILVCKENGRWRGALPRCQKRKCQELSAPKNGEIRCTTKSYQFETECEFTCKEGFFLVGSRRRKCLAVAHWDGIPASCRKIYCPPLVAPSNGRVFPPSCNGTKALFGDQCRYRCQEGHRLTGPAARECIYPGVWSDRETITRCIDTEPPSIECPDDILVPTEAGEPYATVDFSLPSTQDNSGFHEITLTVAPAVEPPLPFFVGETNITYTATDSQGNKNSCTFSVTVLDEEVPTVDRCDSPAVSVSSDGRGAKVDWEEPLFSDNSQEDVFIWSSHKPGQYFPIGNTRVTYVATDNSGNNVTCHFEVVVKANQCEPSFSISNGELDCTEEPSATVCSVRCKQGYLLLPGQQDQLRCSNGDWDFEDVPTCAPEAPASSHGTDAVLECTDTFLAEQLSFRLGKNVTLRQIKKCRQKPKCLRENLMVICELAHLTLVPDGAGGRKRRDASDASDKDDDLDLDDVLHSMDDMMSSVRYGLSQRNHSFHSLCPLGWIHVDHQSCVQCPNGMFHNFLQRTCTPCPIGTYQFKGGQLSCEICPNHTSTAEKSSKSKNDCKPQCVPGMFSKTNGVIPCETCLLGEYQPEYGSNSCQKCPAGMTTLKRRSFQLQDCKHLCEPNTVSRFGVKPCTACPSGYHQPLDGQKGCIPRNEVTQDSTNFLPFNACFASPCRNGGSCSPMDKHFTCICLPGYTGSFCEKRIDECAQLPCGPNATCVLHETSGYTCLCPTGLRGERCDQDVDECLDGSCRNGASCINQFGSFQCICPTGFSGPTCTDDVDECQEFSVRCHNGGRCVNTFGSFRCECLSEFVGEYCDRPSCGCRNGGNCTPGGRCACPTGFWGNRCQYPSTLSYCNSIFPCFNGGSCVDVEPERFVCNCPPGTTGYFCEERIAEDFVLHFIGNTTSDSVRLGAPLGNELLREFTVCLWLRSNDTENYGTPFSYASEDKDNLITITDYSGLVFYVNNHHVISDIKIIDNKWHHLCLAWNTTGTYAVFVNAQTVLEGRNLSSGHAIPSNGTLILGQEQDHPGTGFARMESYAGYITNVYMWSKWLPNSEIYSLFADCSLPVHEAISPKHLVVSWGDFRYGVRGNVQIEESNFCKPCNLPETIPNGYTISNGQDTGSKTQWHCDPNFERIGKQEAVCLKIGEWSSPKPVCVGRYCHVARIQGGYSVPLDIAEVGQVVNFRCNENYIQRGPSNALCLQTTRLNISDYPECVSADSTVPTAAQCIPEEEQIARRKLNITRGTYLNATLEQFDCLPGFRIEGSASRWCNSSGWTSPLPSCHPIVCHQLKLRAPATVTYSDWVSVSSKATVHCPFGFKLRESSATSFECDIHGVWQPADRTADVFCVPIECGELPRFENAMIPQNVSYHVGSTVKVACKPGFETVLDVRLICLQTGKWSELTIDVCQPVQCSFFQLPVIQGASITLFNASTTYNSMAELNCQPGFRNTTPPTSFVCDSTGSWKRLREQLPEFGCRPVSCPYPRHPTNGRAHYTGRGVGASVQFSCRTGFSLNEDFAEGSQCLENGTWSLGAEQLSAVCERKPPCPQLAVPLNGFMTVLETKANFSCDRGYQLVGSGKLRCTDGIWSDVAPECQPQRCAHESEGGLSLENGIFTQTRGAIGDRVGVACRPGYTLQGDSSWLCQDNASWSGASSCVAITCEQPEDSSSAATASFKDYKFGSSIDYSCNHGHVLLGSRVRVCLESGRWSAPVPTCKLVNCPPIDEANSLLTYEPYNSTVYGTSVSLQCADRSHRLIGQAKSTCSESGTWEPPLGSCSRPRNHHCPPSPSAPVQVTKRHGQIYRFSCEVGFRLTGSFEVDCAEDAELADFREPKCIRLASCPKMEAPYHGNVVLHTKPPGAAASETAWAGDEATVICQPGFKLVESGSPIVYSINRGVSTCQNDGSWSHVFRCIK